MHSCLLLCVVFDLLALFFFTLSILTETRTQKRYFQTMKEKKIKTPPQPPAPYSYGSCQMSFIICGMCFNFITLTFSAAVICGLCRGWHDVTAGLAKDHTHMLLLMLPLALMRSFLPFLRFNVTLERFHHFMAVTQGLDRDRKA